MEKQEFESILKYEQETGKLYWKCNLNSRARQGKEAGCVNKNGYKQIRFQGKSYLAHRIAFLLHHGWLPNTIDHKDGNKANNKISNLRAADSSLNNANKPVSKRNKTGIKGVHKATNSEKFVSQIAKNKKIFHLGMFNNIEEAKAAYNKAAEEIFGDFAHLN